MVANIKSPISSLSSPAFSIAFVAASYAKFQFFSSVQKFLCLIPVLEEIHSAFVSTILLKSSFVITFEGIARPVETKSIPVIELPRFFSYHAT